MSWLLDVLALLLLCLRVSAVLAVALPAIPFPFHPKAHFSVTLRVMLADVPQRRHPPAHHAQRARRLQRSASRCACFGVSLVLAAALIHFVSPSSRVVAGCADAGGCVSPSLLPVCHPLSYGFHFLASLRHRERLLVVLVRSVVQGTV